MGSLILIVGVTSHLVNRSIATEVTRLGAGRVPDLGRIDWSAASLEAEGRWSDRLGFLASAIEIMPGPRRPKLRGAIASIDPVARTITLYGVPIGVADSTEFDFQTEPDSDPVTALTAGQRIEVTCDVSKGVWTASKVGTTDVKRSDKVKGTPTATRIADSGSTLEVHGLPIVVDARLEDAPRSALARIEAATQMTVALQLCRVAAYRVASEASSGGASVATDSVRESAIEFQRTLGDLSRASGTPEASNPTAAHWLADLLTAAPQLTKLVAELTALAENDRVAAKAYVQEDIDPYVADVLLPLVYAFARDAEQSLSGQLASVVTGTATTARIAAGTAVVAVLLALVLGALVWRSVHRPVVALQAAARRFGDGDLEARVGIEAKDEFGDLALAFDSMAQRLSSTTVSIDHLDNVFGSMAAALIVVDAAGVVTSVNRATRQLLGYEADGLLGRTLSSLCIGTPPSVGSANEPRSIEIELRRSDQTPIPVLLSHGALRTIDGGLQGYVCAALDLTERRQMEQRLRESLGEKELLLREVHHRVKNNMQVISSLLAMQSSTFDDPLYVERFALSQNRIRSMALIHEQLYRSSDLASIDASSYLETLVRNVADVVGRPEVSVESEIDAVELDLDQSLACGLIVHELVANAFKHAFSDSQPGIVRVLLRAKPDGTCRLVVADNGRGHTAADAAGRSANTLGLSLVETLVKQLGGTLSHLTNGGSRVEVTFSAINSEAAPV